MAIVGIIANPASGKDIRRLVAQALVIGNREKTSIVKRMLVGLHASDVDEVWIMPDKFGIGIQAIDDLQRSEPQIVKRVDILDMEFTGTGIDTIRSARFLREKGAGCILVLGGDGTSRLVSKGCGEVPILPVSTGTNNVLPEFIEGTIAGLAAGLVAAADPLQKALVCYRSKRLDIMVNDRLIDTALVDVAAVSSAFAGSKAIWDAHILRQLIVTRASPGSIGLSSVVGQLITISANDPYGAAMIVDQSALNSVIAPIAPGLIACVPVLEWTRLEPNLRCLIVAERPLMLALDGEREVLLKEGDNAQVVLQTDGPWIVNVSQVMEKAAHEKRFIKLKNECNL